MRFSAVATTVILMGSLSAGSRPAMAQPQHRGGGGHAAPGGHPGGQVPHHGNGGMGQVAPHIQRQMQQQQQEQVRQYQQQMQRMQQEAHRQYQQDLQRFDQWLKANGGSAGQGQGGAAGRLPENPAAFDAWAATQKQRKAQGKKYDPMYDRYRAFVDAHAATQARQGRTHSSPSSSRARAEAKRRAIAGRGRAQDRLPLAQDQAKISLLRTVHAKLQEADRDYDGHRVHAMHSLAQALHHLGSSPPSGMGTASSLGNLPQARSDGILRDALVKLRNVESQFGGTASNAPHHVQARSELTQAIHHLDIALTIR